MPASQFERLLEAAMEQGCVIDAVVAESLQQAHALWHIRESIPLAQAEEGLNIKHDIFHPGLQHPGLLRRDRHACCSAQSPACGW